MLPYMQPVQLLIGIGAGDDSDAEELERITGLLRAELLVLDVDTVGRAPGEPPPEGAKGPVGGSLSTLIVTLSDSTVAASLVTLLQSWIKRKRGRSVSIQIGKDRIDVSNVPAEELTRLIETWIERHDTK
jgi:hypothetical protein